MGRDDTDRAAVVPWEGVAVEREGKERLGAQTRAEGQVGRVVVRSVKEDVFRVRIDADTVRKGRERHTGEVTVEPTPSSHAVEVLSLRLDAQVGERLPVEGD